MNLTIQLKNGIGYFVIDKIVNKTAWGGIRILPDANLEELIPIARTMTRKFAFAGLSFGGAKASVKIFDESKRAETLQEFGQKTAHLIRSGTWIPGVDMGCSSEDIQNVMLGAGIRIKPREGKSHLYTAWTVFFSTLAATGNLRGRTYIIEGFGKVGSEYAKLMHRAGARLVGVSNRKGAVYNAAGFDVPELIRLREEKGDAFITELKGKVKDVLIQKADIIVPCARTFSINSTNRDKIRADYIVCAANAPMDEETEKYLSRTKTIVPDFTANCGGAFGSFAAAMLTDEHICKILKNSYYERVLQLIIDSKITGSSISTLALRQSRIHPLISFLAATQTYLPFWMRTLICTPLCTRWFQTCKRPTGAKI